VNVLSSAFKDVFFSVFRKFLKENKNSYKTKNIYTLLKQKQEVGQVGVAMLYSSQVTSE